MKSQWTNKIKIVSQETDDSKNLRCENSVYWQLEYVNISSSTVLGIKLWLEEYGDLGGRKVKKIQNLETKKSALL